MVNKCIRTCVLFSAQSTKNANSLRSTKQAKLATCLRICVELLLQLPKLETPCFIFHHQEFYHLRSAILVLIFLLSTTILNQEMKANGNSAVNLQIRHLVRLLNIALGTNTVSNFKMENQHNLNLQVVRMYMIWLKGVKTYAQE